MCLPLKEFWIEQTTTMQREPNRHTPADTPDVAGKALSPSAGPALIRLSHARDEPAQSH